MPTEAVSFKVIAGSPPQAYCPCCDRYQRITLAEDGLWRFVKHEPSDRPEPQPSDPQPSGLGSGQPSTQDGPEVGGS